MCFSATASFTASAVLGVVGVATLTKVRDRKALPLALMPIVFAIQQLIEGFLWLSLKGSAIYAPTLTYAFLFFAFLWWPMYVPFMISLLETGKGRKYTLRILSGIGVLVGTFLYAGFLLNPGTASIVNRCVYYPVRLPFASFLTYVYVFITVGSVIFSSRLLIKVFGLLLGIFAVFAWHVYTVNFTSVWCFFAAILSLIIFFYFLLNKKR